MYRCPMTSRTIDVLRTVPIFSSIDDEGLARIADTGTDFEAVAGHVLIEHGQPGTGFFVIEEGTVTIELPGGDSITRGPGEFFGELSVLTDSVRTARVVTTTDVRCFAIRRDDLHQLLHDEPSIAIAMLGEIANRLAQVT